MRYLAVARLRLLTSIRESTPAFVAAALPPLLAAYYEITPEPLFRAAADELLGKFARAAILGWLFHALFIYAVAEAFGSMRLLRVDQTAPSPDLMDSAPITPLTRFWGEALGVFGATVSIHAACLPLLAVIAVLSPLPTAVFVWIEVAIVALMIFGSAGAAWKRLAPRNKWTATRTFRSAILFLILLFATLFATTNWPVFRDSFMYFLLISPSMRGWAAVSGAVEQPVLLVTLWLMLYVGYILYYVIATRKQAEA